MSDPIIFKENGCPVCGGDVMSYDSMEGGNFTDGESAFCADNCGWFGSVCVVEDGGDAFPSTASEIEPFIERMDQMVGLLRECLEVACPNGETPTSDLACRIAAVLEKTPAPRTAPNHEVCGPAPLSQPAEKPDAAGSVSTAVVGQTEPREAFPNYLKGG